jgi:hypothetical protein
MADDLIDRICEAEFRPEYWTNVLEELGAAANSASGLLVVFDETKPVQYKATPVIHDIIRAFCEEHWHISRRASHTQKKPSLVLSALKEYFPSDLLAAMPTGEMVVYSFDKWSRDGSHDKKDIEALNTFYAHLARGFDGRPCWTGTCFCDHCHTTDDRLARSCIDPVRPRFINQHAV